MFRMHIVDLSWTLEDILHQWPWTSSLVSSLFVMLTTWSPLSSFSLPLLLSRSCQSCSDRSSDAGEKPEKTLRAFERSTELLAAGGGVPVPSSDPTDTYFFRTLCWRLPSVFFLSFFFIPHHAATVTALFLSSSSPPPSFHGHAGLRRACTGVPVAEHPHSTWEDPGGHSSCADLLASVRGENKLALTGRVSTVEKYPRLRYNNNLSRKIDKRE